MTAEIMAITNLSLDKTIYCYSFKPNFIVNFYVAVNFSVKKETSKSSESKPETKPPTPTPSPTTPAAEAAPAAGGGKRMKCKYWDKCFRKDKGHKKLYIHPGDPDEKQAPKTKGRT